MPIVWLELYIIVRQACLGQKIRMHLFDCASLRLLSSVQHYRINVVLVLDISRPQNNACGLRAMSCAWCRSDQASATRYGLGRRH